MMILKNFSIGPVQQKAELLERLEAEAALGWTTVSDPLSEKDEALAQLVTLVYNTIRESRDA